MTRAELEALRRLAGEAVTPCECTREVLHANVEVWCIGCRALVQLRKHATPDTIRKLADLALAAPRALGALDAILLDRLHDTGVDWAKVELSCEVLRDATRALCAPATEDA